MDQLSGAQKLELARTLLHISLGVPRNRLTLTDEARLGRDSS